MSTAQRFAPVLAVLLFALLGSARAQTTSVEVALDGDSARFNAQGEAVRVRVEIYAPGGEMLFAGEAAEGGAVEWSLRDKAGRRVADGVYLAAVTVVDPAGRVTKRVEQVVVGGDAQAFAAAGPANAPNPTPQAPATLTGEGTNGKIAKFTGQYTLGNSVITESAGKINVGANATPTATLQVNGAQPPTVANGTNAVNLLQTMGGKGGNTNAASTTGGAGANILLAAGNGGNAVSGATNGSGGSITLQSGSPGTGGTGGSNGKVIIAPTVGNVGIGTTTPGSKLTVVGTTSANLVSVENNSTAFTGVGLYAKGRPGVYGFSTGGTSAGLYGEGNFGVWGKAAGTAAKSAGVFGQGSSDPGVRGESVGDHGVYGESEGSNYAGVYGVNVNDSASGKGVSGFSSRGYGVYGRSVNGYAGKFDGVVGVSSTVEIGGTAFFGATTRQMILLYNNTYAIGVQPSTHYSRTNNGFAWYKGGTHVNTAFSPGTGGVRLMKLDSAGNLTATSFSPVSDRNAKANFAAVSPRQILDKLRALPIQTWSYKVDDDAVKHIGPVAQDFKAAFDLGSDDKTISTVDADGVALAAIQGLYQLTVEQNRELARQVAELRSQVMQLRQAVKSRVRPMARGRRQRR